jgi:hypothetical protein
LFQNAEELVVLVGSREGMNRVMPLRVEHAGLQMEILENSGRRHGDRLAQVPELKELKAPAP